MAFPASTKGEAKQLLYARCGHRECVTVLMPAESREVTSFLEHCEGYAGGQAEMLRDGCVHEVLTKYVEAVEPEVEVTQFVHRN